MLEASQSWKNSMRKCLRSLAAFMLVLMIAACQNAAAPAQHSLSSPTPIEFAPLNTLLKSIASPGDVTTAGYVVVDSIGATLVDGLSFTSDGKAQLLDNTRQIWLGPSIQTNIQARLRTGGTLQFAPVRAHGRLEGPGAYGPSLTYHYQMVGPSLEVLASQETTIDDLLKHSAGYENQLVRLVGSLIAGDSSALLVDQLGTGGLPMPKARQIKLPAPLQDRALFSRLKGVSGGSIRFGRVQIEGFWHNGVLIPLSIILVT